MVELRDHRLQECVVDCKGVLLEVRATAPSRARSFSQVARWAVLGPDGASAIINSQVGIDMEVAPRNGTQWAGGVPRGPAPPRPA